MKYIILLITFTFSFNSYSFLSTKKNKVSKEFELKCVKVEEDKRIYRCENKEVVCYTMGDGYEDGHSSCKFKKK